MQIGFYFDQTRCTGCGACQVACKDWNDIPAGPIRWMRLAYVEKGKCPNLFVSHFITPCFHCLTPVCAAACPVGAISKRSQDGVVTVDSDICIGRDTCGESCLKACPYDAPQFGPELDGKMSKCNFCLDRWLEEKLPVCIEACPTRALDAGPLDDLVARYGQAQSAAGFFYSERTKPAVVCRPKPVSVDR